MPPVFQCSPRASYQAHRAAIDAAAARVFSSESYILGPETEAFEKEFAHYVGVGHAVGVANGTDALELALRVLGVGPGDGVLTVAHTALPTVAAIVSTGATPVLVDIDADSCTLSPAALSRVLAGWKPGPGRPVLKALLCVHLYGRPADLDALLALARDHGLQVVEDCAQAHGATWGERRVGSFGAVSAFSFYPTKNLGAIGDGGAVLTSDPCLAVRLRQLRQAAGRPLLRRLRPADQDTPTLGAPVAALIPSLVVLALMGLILRYMRARNWIVKV